MAGALRLDRRSARRSWPRIRGDGTSFQLGDGVVRCLEQRWIARVQDTFFSDKWVPTSMLRPLPPLGAPAGVLLAPRESESITDPGGQFSMSLRDQFRMSLDNLGKPRECPHALDDQIGRAREHVTPGRRKQSWSNLDRWGKDHG